MRTKFIAMTLAVLTGCTSTSAQDSASRSERLSSESPEKVVVLSYKNGSKDAQCILADDFRDHPLRPILRVVGRDGTVARYSGIQLDRELEPDLPAFIIIPSGKSVEARFDVGKNYAVQHDRRYQVYYSLPVTPCYALNTEELEVPIASMPFYLGPIDDFTNWSDRLAGVRGVYETWAAIGGEFVELEGVAE